MSVYRNRRARAVAAHLAAWTPSRGSVFSTLDISKEKLNALAAALVGTLAIEGDSVYQQDESHWNKAFNDKPALIVFCEVPGDVRACLEFARSNALPFVCRSGGHNTAGYALSNGGLVIDVSRMDDVHVRVDDLTVTIGPGANFHKIDAILDSYGLHMPSGGCPDVCIAGYMQGGGYGFTSRMFGLSCDNVLQVTVMLADGSIVHANGVTHPDLFWAIRGGTGNNFGVLLEATFQVRPLGSLWAFGLCWTSEEADEALHALQERFTSSNASRLLSWQGMLVMRDGAPCFLARGLVNGDRTTGLQEISGMRAVGNPTLEIDQTGSYRLLNRLLLEDLESGILESENGNPLKEDKFSVYLARTLSAVEWRHVIDFYTTCPMASPLVGMEIYGAATRDAAGSNAFVHRDVSMDFFVDTFWYDPGDEAKARGWLAEFRALMRTFWNGHSYQNYPQRGDADYRFAFWGDAFPSLLDVKTTYDPHGLFAFPMGVSPYPDDPAVRRSTAPSRFPPS